MRTCRLVYHSSLQHNSCQVDITIHIWPCSYDTDPTITRDLSRATHFSRRLAGLSPVIIPYLILHVPCAVKPRQDGTRGLCHNDQALMPTRLGTRYRYNLVRNVKPDGQTTIRVLELNFRIHLSNQTTTCRCLSPTNSESRGPTPDSYQPRTICPSARTSNYLLVHTQFPGPWVRELIPQKKGTSHGTWTACHIGLPGLSPVLPCIYNGSLMCTLLALY